MTKLCTKPPTQMVTCRRCQHSVNVCLRCLGEFLADISPTGRGVLCMCGNLINDPRIEAMA